MPVLRGSTSAPDKQSAARSSKARAICRCQGPSWFQVTRGSEPKSPSFAVSSTAAGFIAEFSYRAGFLIEAG
ncbi:hypothetical protein AB0C13_37900, partial [Streptomyces sp. NPDC049099]|uniref:hypothetical protein n=1 Tax=Streptomyces sp. NPDC049099 TaxID=3155768 RepID=UPI00342825C5